MNKVGQALSPAQASAARPVFSGAALFLCNLNLLSRHGFGGQCKAKMPATRSKTHGRHQSPLTGPRLALQPLRQLQVLLSRFQPRVELHRLPRRLHRVVPFLQPRMAKRGSGSV